MVAVISPSFSAPCPRPDCEDGVVPDVELGGYWVECPVCHGDSTIECLDGPDGCGGEPVSFRSADGRRAWPRCGNHFAKRLDTQEHINELTSPTPARWFREDDAGERWDSDY